MKTSTLQSVLERYKFIIDSQNKFFLGNNETLCSILATDFESHL